MAASSLSRLTTSEQEKLLAAFYKEIYQEERNFANNGEVPKFVDEDESDDDDHDDDFVETDADVGEETVIDINRDEEAPEDEPEPEPAISWKHKFSSYEKVCDSNNCEILPDQEEETFVWSNKCGDRYEWSTLKNDVVNTIGRGRRSAANICLSSGGPTTMDQRNAKSPVNTWSLMIPDCEIMKIVNFTNKKITQLHAIRRDRLEETEKITHYNLTSLTEMKAWFGLLYLCATLKLSTTYTDIVWYHESSNDIFSATMQWKRFIFLTRIIQFDDAEVREEWWNHDKFAAFREFFESVNRKFLKLRKPSPHVVIDETLYSYRGRISFKQYNPSKPAKYDLLFRSLYDSKVQLTYVSLPYAGKPTGTPNSYYVTGTDKYTEYLVSTAIELGERDCVKGRNISLDRYFTSMAIADWCLERNITITGTLKSDRKGIPKEMKAAPKDGPVRDSKSTKWCYNAKKVLLSYADEKKSGTKIFLALTTMFDVMRVSKDQRKKPEPLVYYEGRRGCWCCGSCVNWCFDEGQDKAMDTEC